MFGCLEKQRFSWCFQRVQLSVWFKAYSVYTPQIYTQNMNYRNSSDESSPDEIVHGKDSKWESLHTTSLYEREADRLLDGLGPRFVDWWMQKPLPVDGDLLPEYVPGFKSPFRICPPFTRSKLMDTELTYLRRTAYHLPTHYVLGRNMKLHGLATSILKL